MKELGDMSLEELWQLFPIVLKEHSPAYAAWYRAEEARLMHLLHGNTICRVSHIGSTAVAGLLAKPIVDILLELPASYEPDRIADLLQGDHWIVMARDDGAGTLDLNKGYTPNGFAERVFHLHIKPPGDWGELYFRDYLRQFPEVAARYGALKLRLGERFEHDRDAYTDAKAAFVHDITHRAREAFPVRYLPNGAERS